jgi:hypothetical protein
MVSSSICYFETPHQLKTLHAPVQKQGCNREKWVFQIVKVCPSPTYDIPKSRSTALIEKLTVAHLLKKLPYFLWKPKIHYRLHNSPPMEPTLRQHIYPNTLVFKICFNIIIPPSPISSKLSHSYKLFYKNFWSIFPFPACSMGRPSHSQQLYITNTEHVTAAVTQSTSTLKMETVCFSETMASTKDWTASQPRTTQS